LGLPPII
jgi:casein kinase I homolog HRR25